MPSKMGLPSLGMSDRVLQNTILTKIGLSTDNVVLQYLLGLIAISLLTAITGTLPKFLKKIQRYVLKYFEHDYPTIKFVITRDKKNPYLNSATSAVVAWMEQLKIVIDAQTRCPAEARKVSKDSIGMVENACNILKLRNVATHKGRVLRSGGLSEVKDHWLPDQSEAFLIAENIYAKLTMKTLEHKEKGEAQATDEYTLSIYTNIKNYKEEGMKYLLNYHNKLVSNYELSLKSKFENKPHIFEFDCIDDKEGCPKWVANEFSSSRQLKHLWFEEKGAFVDTYKRFLYNQESYLSRGDPYTFSVLLYGPPGCGKTSLLKALINYDLFERKLDNSDAPFISHLFVVPFSKMDCIETFNKIMFCKNVNGTEIAMNQRIYVFEDFDANVQSDVFNIRDSLRHTVDWSVSNPSKMSKFANYAQNASNNAASERKDNDKFEADLKQLEAEGKIEELQELQRRQRQDETMDKLRSIFSTDKGANGGSGGSSGMHLSDLLNTLDGLCERTGQRCVWTTNKSPPQRHFDPAFLRPGRMDMIIKLGECTREGVAYLLKQYFSYDLKCEDMDEKEIEDLELDLDGIDDRRFTPAQIKQICKEAGCLDGAVAMLKQVCAVKAEDVANAMETFEDAMQKNDAKDGIKFKSMERCVSEPVPLRFVKNEHERDTLMDKVKKLHSGHWLGPLKKTEKVQMEPKLLVEDKDVMVKSGAKKTRYGRNGKSSNDRVKGKGGNKSGQFDWKRFGDSKKSGNGAKIHVVSKVK